MAWVVKYASSVPGYHGEALYTGGPNQYVEMTLDEKNRCLQNPDWYGSGVAFSFWVMNLPGNTKYRLHPIYESNGCRIGQIGFCLGHVRDHFFIVIRSNSHEYRNRIPPLEANEWQHVTFTSIVSGIIKLYVNGCDSTSYRILEGYQLVTAPTGSATARSTSFRFGSKWDGTHMKLDHVLIWYDVLSADDTWKLYLQEGIV